MDRIQIQSLTNKHDTLNIGSVPGHDMWVQTERCNHANEDYAFGQSVRIYSWAGSMAFADVHDQFYKSLTTRTKQNEKLVEMDADALDLEKFEKVELIDYVADQSILTIFRDEAGRIGVQTSHTEYDFHKGPLVWICADKESDTSPSMRARRRIFTPIFDLTRELAARFNRPKPQYT